MPINFRKPAHLLTGTALRLVRSRFGRDQQGVALVEFALFAPLVLGFMLSAMELANYLLATQKVQKVAFMTADMLARSTVQPDEKQVEDVFLSMDLAAKPFDLRGEGRVILTGVVGMEDSATSDVENKLAWQRCDGDYTSFGSALGSEDNKEPAEREAVAFHNNLQLPQSQMIISSEVVYNYKPIVNIDYFSVLGVPQRLTSTATLRSRNRAFTDITPVNSVTPKTCEDGQNLT